MSTTIVMPELDTLKSITQKYLIEKIGINLRPTEPYYDEKENLWIVPCKAIIPNYISNKGEEGKTFLYTFESVCEIVFKKEQENFILIDFPSSNEIEIDLSKRMISLTHQVEKELLICGQNSWGKLTLLKQYLSPLYSMISYLLDIGEIPFNIIKLEKNIKYKKYVDILINSKYMRIANDDKKLFVEGNRLIKLKEKYYEKKSKSEYMSIVENIVGQIFVENADYIKNNMGIKPPFSYVDTTKLYYFNALKYGKNIGFTENDFVKEFKFYGNLLVSPRDFNLKNSLFELCAYSLLNKSQEYYFGDKVIYEHLYKVKENLVSGGDEFY